MLAGISTCHALVETPSIVNKQLSCPLLSPHTLQSTSSKCYAVHQQYAIESKSTWNMERMPVLDTLNWSSKGRDIYISWVNDKSRRNTSVYSPLFAVVFGTSYRRTSMYNLCAARSCLQTLLWTHVCTYAMDVSNISRICAGRQAELPTVFCFWDVL